MRGGEVLQSKRNEERCNGKILSEKVREGHIVGVTPDQDLNAMRDRAARLCERRAFQARKSWRERVNVRMDEAELEIQKVARSVIQETKRTDF